MINNIGRLFPNYPTLTVDSILNSTSKKTGLNNWEDESFIEGLDILLKSSKEESKMTFISRILLKQMCVQIVKDRLLLEENIIKYSEILNTKIEKPIFILGLPRSGTTYIQNLLAQDDQFRPLYYFEQQSVGLPPTPETLLNNPQIKKAKRDLSIFNWIAPEFFTAHDLKADRTEEDNGLMGREFVNILHFMFRNTPTYVDWILNKDMTTMYQYHKKQLQYLGNHFHNNRWMLKAPVHMAFFDSLLKIYPDARIIHTHRDPIDSLPSMCSLAVISRQIFSDHVDPKETGKQWLDLMSMIINRFIKQNEILKPKNTFHLSYKKLVANPMATISQLYEKFNLEITENSKTKITNWMKSSQKFKKKNPHIYSLEQFGLSNKDIKQKFNDYYEMYNDYL